MIAFIKGEIAALTEQQAVVENQGIGYEVYMPTSMLSHLRIGEQACLYTHFYVKEDAMQLFGFLSQESVKVFRLLIGVNGIGPKAALGILSVLSTDELRFAVLSSDVQAISRAPGIGKKTAQKIILELKDKMSLEEAFEEKLAHQQQAGSTEVSLAVSEAVQALTALGYSGTDALRAVKAAEPTEEMDTEAILKAALKKMV